MHVSLKTCFKKIPADTHTPVSVYLQLRDRFPGSLLLESSDYHGQENSLSFICCDPIATFCVEHEQLTCRYPDGRQEQTPARAVPGALGDFIAAFSVDPPPFPFPCSGLFGYTAYDAVRYFEDIRLQGPENAAKCIPDLFYALYRFVLVFDHFHDELVLIETAPAPAPGHLDELQAWIERRGLPRYRFEPLGDETSDCTDAQYRAMVAEGKQACQRGEVFQVVLSREFSQGFRGDEFQVYRALRRVNPSPYLFYFDYGNFRLFGSSPEAQLIVRKGEAQVHPIAGTVRRTGDDGRDQEQARLLAQDPKEQAEHVMLVDLARNDLGRHCTGVQVDVFAETQYYSHVIHLVSKVSGRLQQTHPVQVFADTFPAGTLSGAPKYRAMQLIDRLEPSRRGFYGGAIGYLGFDGTFNHAIIIRSFLSKNNRLYYRAGAGVVIRSSEEGELQEVNHKLAAPRKAIASAECGVRRAEYGVRNTEYGIRIIQHPDGSKHPLS